MCLILVWRGVGLLLACYKVFIVPVLQSQLCLRPHLADLLGTERDTGV